MKVLRVDMSKASISMSEDVPEALRDLGGRAFTSTVCSREIPPDCDPLGPENKLIIAPGALSGTSLINTSRLSIGGKSPLTGGIKESNVGGTAAADLAKLGLQGIVVEGQAADGRMFLLRITADGTAELIPADAYQGQRTYSVVSGLHEQFGEKHSVLCIGPAGEFKLKAASIQSSDLDGRPCRAAGRGGLGAVMGSKGLKGICIDRSGKESVPIAEPERFKEAAKVYARKVKEDEFSGEILPELGTAVLVAPINAAGAFPTRNARLGQFEQWEKIKGETMAEMIKKRGGKTEHKGCAQCIINCSNEFVDAQGKYVTSSLEYETIWSMGGMLENADLDVIARLDFLCDDIGLDTMSTGVAIAVAMDAGYRAFGDGQAAIDLVEEVAKGTEIGRIIGNGPQAVGDYFGHSRVPVAKGQSIGAYDPRAIQGMAVTYATSPMGGDHTAGWVVEQSLAEFGGELDPLSREGQVEASRNMQIHMAAVDSIGLCDFAQSGLAGPEGNEALMQMISAKFGRPYSEQDWQELGLLVLKAERDFNRRAGFTQKDDRLAGMFYEEPLPPHNRVVLVTDEDMDATFDF